MDGSVGLGVRRARGPQGQGSVGLEFRRVRVCRVMGSRRPGIGFLIDPVVLQSGR